MTERCRICKNELTEEEAELSYICDGCAIDAYEEQRRIREQAYLEDDRNFPTDVE